LFCPSCDPPKRSQPRPIDRTTDTPNVLVAKKFRSDNRDKPAHHLTQTELSDRSNKPSGPGWHWCDRHQSWTRHEPKDCRIPEYRNRRLRISETSALHQDKESSDDDLIPGPPGGFPEDDYVDYDDEPKIRMVKIDPHSDSLLIPVLVEQAAFRPCCHGSKTITNIPCGIQLCSSRCSDTSENLRINSVGANTHSFTWP
jgi:hypothetical protein